MSSTGYAALVKGFSQSYRDIPYFTFRYIFCPATKNSDTKRYTVDREPIITSSAKNNIYPIFIIFLLFQSRICSTGADNGREISSRSCSCKSSGHRPLRCCFFIPVPHRPVLRMHKQTHRQNIRADFDSIRLQLLFWGNIEELCLLAVLPVNVTQDNGIADNFI